jgi:hypothetical protein
MCVKKRKEDWSGALIGFEIREEHVRGLLVKEEKEGVTFGLRIRRQQQRTVVGGGG